MEYTDEGIFPCLTPFQPLYSECSSAASDPVLYTWPDGFVFNPIPEYPYCVLHSNCPFP